MSRENVKKFMELVQTEESLAKRMAALKDGLQEGEFSFKNDKEFVEKEILPLAKEYGIEFSVEDFMEFTSSQLTSLSEEELAEVSGGFIGECFAALAIALGSSAAVAAVKNVVSFFTGSGTSTSMVQSVTTEGTDETANEDTEEKSNKIEFVDRFDEIRDEFSQSIKKAFKGINSYMSPEDRSTWIESIALHHEQINPREDKYVNSRYNKANDRIEITATWTDKLSHRMDRTKYSQDALNDKLSNNLKQQYDEAYGSGAAQLTQQYNDLSQQLQQKQTSLGQYASIDQYQQSINIGYQTINNLISQLQPSVNGTLDMKTDFNALKESFMNQGGQWHHGTYYYTYATQINLIDQILTQQQNIEKDQKNSNNRDALANEINKIESQMERLNTQLAPHVDAQQKLLANMKTEFDYFYGELVKALKEDENISELANSANTTEAKTTLANKIKEKADTIINDKLNKQLLDGCKIEIEQTELMFNIKVHYNGVGWNNSFSVDEFISAENHMEIVNSESSKKREEIISKIANHVNSTSSSSSDLKLAVQSVFEQIRDKTVNLELGVDITTASSKNITFSFTSGGKTRTTSFGVDAVVDKCNQLKNMQAMEATRQKNEGTIEYTPFGRKRLNSIGSQARHVLYTIAQIKYATGNLSDVKDREAFENDLKYVADRILTREDGTPYGLKGDSHTNTRIKSEDLQKIQKFAAKIGQ